MKALESQIGQNATDFSDVLFRTVMADGRNALQVLHQEGFIKKVPTSQILITPTSKSSVRLDELNSILDEMESGEAAVKRLAELDRDAGMVGRKKVREGREVGMPPNSTSASRTNIDVEANASAAAYIKGALSDDDLAADRLSQAAQMQKQAEQLLAEAKRLTEEAKSLTPAKTNAKTTRAKKATPSKKQAA
jgi:hypothetical protein